MDSKLPYRAQRSTPKPTVQGPQTAMVVGKAGEEIWTDQYGRVKVQFHWDRYSKGDETSSCWIRVAQVWAGKNWGAMFIPRIGHEVIVEFLEGDPDRPIITGRVYNGAAMPPYDLPTNKTQSGIKSRSTKEGTGVNFNEIRFEDLKGQEQVYIHAEKNQDNVVENDETTEVGHDRTENVGNDETITIDNNRTETVHNNETITIDHNRTESVGDNEAVQIGANQSLSVGGNQTETVMLAKAETIALAKALSIGAGYQVSVGAAKNESVGLSSSEQVGINKHMVVGKRYELRVGSSSLVLNADGTIILKGKEILIEGSKQTTVNGKMVEIN